MPKKIVMCPPTYFDVVYELHTNKWMNLKNPPDYELAQRQWRQLYEACLNARMDVILQAPRPNLPDMTFMANAGIQYQDAFILSNFFHKERRPESKFNGLLFEKLFKEVFYLPSDAFFEGQGDALWIDDEHILIGYGIRTNLEGVRYVEKLLKTLNPKIEVIPLLMQPADLQFQQRGEIFYHLDTCLAHLPHKNTFIAYDYPLNESALKTLESLSKVIVVNQEEAKAFLCNTIVANQQTLFCPIPDRLPSTRSKIGQGIKNQLARLGYTTIKEFPMSEFIKAGGAVKCLVLEI